MTTATAFTTLAEILALGLRDDLKGPRTSGSLSETGIEGLSDRPVTEFRPEVGDVPVARYFRFDAPEIGGRLGAILARDLTPEQLPLVQTRFVPKHGLAFFLDVDPSEADLPAVGHVTVILGPVDEQGTLGFWTWFPGDVAGTLTIHDQKFTDTPVDQIGVKLHNG